MFTKRLCLIAAVALALAGCGAPGADPAPPDDPPPDEGVRLEGDPDTPVEEATYNLNVPIVPSQAEISVDDERRVLRTELEISVAEGATLEQVNELLDKYDGLIVSMLDNVSSLVIRVPDPGDLDALEALIAELSAEEVVEFVLESVFIDEEPTRFEIIEPESVSPQLLPDGIVNFQRVDHQLAVRGHGAWNLKDALPDLEDRPYIVIADLFGDDAPTSAEGYDVDIVDSDDFVSDNAHNHGYHVLGIITGAFDPVPFASAGVDDVTGIFPGTLRVRAVDLRAEDADTWPRRTNLIIQRIEELLDDDPDARIVVNTSLNSRGYSDQNNPAVSWARKVRGGTANAVTVGAGFEHNFIHFTSAGNARPDTGPPFTQRWHARDNSLFAYAAIGDMELSIPGLTVTIPNLSNTVVVENRVNLRNSFADNQRPLPGCAFDGTIIGGTLSGIGTSVWSFTATWPGTATGTSMATPQAAGIAAYAWALNPQLTVPQLKALMLETAADIRTNTATPGPACHADFPQPVVDAYDAVLAAGGDAARTALLDVGGSGQFDEGDIESYLDAFADDEGDLNYSRFDLSGDGRTGSRERDERFDLDADRAYGTVESSIPDPFGRNLTISFREDEVNDFEVLCYYAFSPIYAGSPAARDLLLSEVCSGATLVIDAVDDGGSPLDNVPIMVLRDGEPELVLRRDLGGGRVSLWVPPAEAYDLDFVTYGVVAGESSLAELRATDEVELTVTLEELQPDVMRSRVDLAGLNAAEPWHVAIVYPSIVTDEEFEQAGDAAEVDAEGWFTLSLQSPPPSPIELVGRTVPPGVTIAPDDVEGADVSLMLFNSALLSDATEVYLLKDPANTFGFEYGINLQYVDRDYTATGTAELEGFTFHVDIDGGAGWGRTVQRVLPSSGGDSEVEVTHSNVLSGLFLEPGDLGALQVLRAPELPLRLFSR